MSIADANYVRDARNCEADKPIILYTDDGAEIELPTTWVVCDVCDGKGTHVNPAIDCNGLTAEDFAEDPDFAESYMAGHYDQPCNKCSGRTTIRGLDLDAMPKDMLAAYYKQCDEESEDRAMQLAEIRAGA